MLRITLLDATDEPCLRLEGRLIGPWVAELNDAVAAAGSPRRSVRLDLAGVSFADAQGVALLQFLQQRGAVLERVTPFVAELLRSSLP